MVTHTVAEKVSLSSYDKNFERIRQYSFTSNASIYPFWLQREKIDKFNNFTCIVQLFDELEWLLELFVDDIFKSLWNID